jgi:hypothetical protein
MFCVGRVLKFSSKSQGIVTKIEHGHKNGLCMHLGKPLTEEALTPLFEEYQKGTLRIGFSA